MPALIFDYHFIKAQKYFKSSEEQAEKVHEKSPQVLWEILDRLLDKAAPFWSTNEVLGTTIRLIREMGQRYKHDSLRLLALCRVAEEMLGVSIGYDKCSQGDHEMVPMSANAVTAPSSSISFVAAANRGATKIIERFLALQGERLPRDHKVRALYQAALQGHTEIVHILLTQGRLTKQDINQVILDPSEEALDNHTSILSAAAKNGHLEIVQLLVNHGAEVNFEAENAPTAEEKDNRPLLSSALEYATANNRREIIDFLLSNGALIGNALQIAIDSSGPDLAEFFVKIAKQKGRIAECGSALLDAAKSQRLDIVMLFLGQGVPPTRGILDAIAANFNDQDLLNIFSHLKHPRYKEGALRAAIHSGRFLTAGYLLSEGVNIDYLASRGKTLLGSLVQEIEASLKQDVQVKAESLEASWKIKLRFLLEHGANPEVLNCSPSVLALLGEKTPVKLKFNYFYMQSAAKPDQEEKYEEDDQAFQVQELRNRLLGSLCNAELPQSQFSFFTGKSRSVPAAVIEDIRAICEQEEWSTQALEILIKIAREAGVEVKTSYSLSLNQVVGENTRRPAGLSLVLEEGIGKEEQKEEDLLNSRASLNSDASFFSAPVSSSSGWFPKSWAITSWTSVFSPTPKNPPSSAKSLKKNEPLQSQQQMQGNNTKSQNLGLSFDG
ncbi:MAG: Pfs, and Ankyrin domain protein [Gammaproteobacteria bacterium]|nr:Pfs, and Ankyrin domain protein [Gammaproteobacteria bacterium]